MKSVWIGRWHICIFLSLTIETRFRFNYGDRKRERERERGECDTEELLDPAVLTRGETQRDRYLAVEMQRIYTTSKS
jgi:hypothetical protein